MTTQLSPTPIFKAFDNVGLPLSFGLLYTYQAGTTTPQATYTDSTGNTPNPNPVLLNARGEAQIWLNPLQNYKFLLTDALGNQIPGWPVDNISGSLYPGQSIIPNTDNAFDIGSLSDRWRNGYFGTQIFVGPDNAPIVDSSGNVGYWARTAAEIAAGVTPVNFAYAPSPVIDIQRYGYKPDGITNNDGAFSAAMAVLSAQGGGVLRLPPGQGNYATGIAVPANVSIIGAGQNATTLHYTGSNTALLFGNSAAARAVITDLTLTGASKTGTGIQVGDTDFAGKFLFSRLYISAFATGIRFAAALWTVVEDCFIQQNTVGVDFNAGSASVFNSSVQFFGTIIHLNDLQGVKATFVPINNLDINFYGCTIQNNCATDVTKPQWSLRGDTGGGGARGVVMDGTYTEYKQGGTPPDFADISILTCARFSGGHMDTAAYGFRDRIGGSASQVQISHWNTTGLTQQFISATSEVDFVEFCNNFSGSLTLTGTSARSLSGTALAGWAALTTTWTPTIKGASTAGTPTYTAQSATYSKVGNAVTFKCKVAISAKGGMVGAISIEGLPVGAATLIGVNDIFAAEMTGVTVSGSNTYLYAQLVNGGTSIQLFQGGSTTPAQLTDTALANATTVVVSGSYQSAS